MKKWTLLLAFLVIIASLNAQSKKMKIAVMDFRPGVGVSQSETEGLSDMLINTLFQTGKFEIIERTQIDQAKKELKFQETEPTYEQIAQMGRFLGVEAVLIGTVNKLFDDYNVDVRAINVESAMVVTTAGKSLDKKSASAFRKMMEKLGKELSDNLIEEKTVVVEEEKKPVIKKESFRKSGFTLRPEVGLNIPLNKKYYRSFAHKNQWGNTDYLFDTLNCLSYATSPSVELAIGYQAGPHFFFGIIGGYGGKLNGYCDDLYKDTDGNHMRVRVTYSTYSFPLKADIRWYLIDHKYSFIVDFQPGISFLHTYVDSNIDESGINKVLNIKYDFRLGLGFAVGNFEASISGDVEWNEPFELWRLNLNLAYRFGNVITFKKWW